jgi:hypothetical protein
VQDIIERGTFSNSSLKNLTTLSNALAKLPALTTFTLVYSGPRFFGKSRYGKQYSNSSDRYMAISHTSYRYLVQAATKTNTTCMVKEIRLSAQSTKVFKADKSLRIKCVAVHVFAELLTSKTIKISSST